MNRRHGMQSSPVQQMMAAGNPTWWNVNNMRAPLTMNNHASSSPHHLSFLTQFQPTTNSNLLPFLPSWHNNDDNDDNNNNYPNQSQEHLPESWSQFLFGGVVSEDDKANGMRQLIHQAKKLEDWEEHMYSHQAHSVSQVRDDVKQKDSLTQSSFVYGNHGNNSSEDFQSIALSQLLPTGNITAASASSPKSSSVTSFGSGVLDFSGKSEGRHPPPSRSSSECNSSATGGPAKKARVQPYSSSSSAQPTFKVRKEKLGDRVTALHQLVSPFGKTDTASVLLEAIGYIRFLHNQIEALSLPYLGSGSSPNMRLQQQSSSVHGERNCMFPEDPGQLLNDNCMKLKGINSEQDAYQEAKKDLRSRGLCLVPVSCTLHVGSDNGADYWAPAALGGGFQ